MIFSNDSTVRGWRHVLSVVLGIALATACSGGGGGGNPSVAAADTPSATAPAAPVTPIAGIPPSVAPPAAASVLQQLEVPAALADGTFSGQKNLLVPPGFGIRLWARVPGARFMALAPNGDVLVSLPGAGKIVLLRERINDVPQAFDYATDLHNPQDMVFHRIGDITYLYVAESNRITRSVYQIGETVSGARAVLIDGLPDNSTPELQGSYGHELKNIALSPDHKLYLSIASTCNVCVSDTVSNPVRGAIYQLEADGSGGRLFARGIRNAEGLDILPGTNTLWIAVNNRDEIRVPFDVDVDGDGTTDLGKLLPSYVDDHPPELFTSVRDGGNYGWPFCNPAPNATMSNMELEPDYELNRAGAIFNCAMADRSAKGILAHSAPLGFSFLHTSSVPLAYRKGAAVALHGCWNCTSLRAGYKVVYFPFDDAGNAGAEMDLVTGFVTDPVGRVVWGRPVDVIADIHGNLLISDDLAGAVYQLYPKP